MYKQYINILRSICNAKGFQMECIGRPGKYELYKIIAGPNSASKRICISTGIHGTEESGPYAVLEFLEEYTPLPGVKLIVLPVSNPYGFDQIKRNNARDLNLNRCFKKDKLIDEAEALFDAVKDERLYLFAAFHEDDEQKGFYMYAHTNKEHALYRYILEAAAVLMPVCKDKKIYTHRADGGLILYPKADGSFEGKLGREGVPHSLNLEFPDHNSLEERIDLVNKMMHKLVLL